MKKTYYKLVSKLTGLKSGINKFDFNQFRIKLRDDHLDLPFPSLHKLNPNYVLIRNLSFQIEVSINKILDFKSLLKFKVINCNYSVVFRDYPLGFFAKLMDLDKPKLVLKLPPKVKSINSPDINLFHKIRINEEIVKIRPYIRQTGRKRLLKVSIIKTPLNKNYFSKEQMRVLREKTAQQNKTGWSNVKIFEIYDKFYPNFYSNIKQISGSKNLECKFSSFGYDVNPAKTYYLAIGQKQDTGQSIRAIVDPADIKKVNNN